MVATWRQTDFKQNCSAHEAMKLQIKVETEKIVGMLESTELSAIVNAFKADIDRMDKGQMKVQR